MMALRFRKTLTGVALLAAGALLTAAGQPAKTRAVARNWNATVTATPEGGYLLGNPAARVKLVEFVSYTCPHCAHFEKEAADQLKVSFVSQGKGSVEVRPFVRDPVDMTVALLTRCGPKDRFFTRHTMFLRQQDKWMAPLRQMSPSQQQRWFTGEPVKRFRAVATDLRFYDIMRTLGFDGPAVDRCLANTALADQLSQHTADAAKQFNIEGTPSFVVNGVLLAGTHSWATLRPQLEARMR